MSRAVPTILAEATNPKTLRTLQVMEAAAVYAVFYDGAPINMRAFHSAFDSGARYMRTSFANPGFAHNLARKLNAKFGGDRFQVFELMTGHKIDERSR